MGRPAELTDSEFSDIGILSAFSDSGESTPEENYYLWKRPNTEEFIRKLKELISDYPNGLLLKDFFQAYKEKYREPLAFQNYGPKTVDEFLMDYSDVLETIRQGTSSDGWLIIDASRAPTEEEKTTLSTRLNPELVDEFKVNVGRTVEHYISHKFHEFRLGMPIDALQNYYKNLFGCYMDFKILGFQTLESFCLANDGKHFHICGLGRSYVILPRSEPWRCPEPLPEEPLPLRPLLLMREPEREMPSIPKDMAGPEATYFEINYKRYLIPGDRVQIKIAKYVDPLNFYFVLKAFDTVREDFYNDLETFYNNNHDLHIPIPLIKPGQCCVVSFSNSEPHQYRGGRYRWGRARVIELINEELARVMLVDIGKTTMVRIHWMRFLAKQFISFPVQIIPGMLAGVAPKDETLGRFDQASMQLLSEYSVMPTLDAEIHSPDFNRPIFPVIIFAFDSKKSLNRVLIDSCQNRHLPQVPYCILTRKLPENQGSYGRGRDEIHPYGERRWMFNDQPFPPAVQDRSQRNPRDFDQSARNDCLDSSSVRRHSPVSYQSEAQPSATQSRPPSASDESQPEPRLDLAPVRPHSPLHQSRVEPSATQSRAPPGATQPVAPPAPAESQSEPRLDLAPVRPHSPLHQSRVEPSATQSSALPGATQPVAPPASTESQSEPRLDLAPVRPHSPLHQSRVEPSATQSRAPPGATQPVVPPDPAESQSERRLDLSFFRRHLPLHQSRLKPSATQARAPPGATQPVAPPASAESQSEPRLDLAPVRPHSPLHQSRVEPSATQSRPPPGATQPVVPPDPAESQSELRSGSSSVRRHLPLHQSRLKPSATQARTPPGATQPVAPPAPAESQSERRLDLSFFRRHLPLHQSRLKSSATQARAPPATTQPMAAPAPAESQSEPQPELRSGSSSVRRHLPLYQFRAQPSAPQPVRPSAPPQTTTPLAATQSRAPPNAPQPRAPAAPAESQSKRRLGSSSVRRHKRGYRSRTQPFATKYRTIPSAIQPMAPSVVYPVWSNKQDFPSSDFNVDEPMSKFLSFLKSGIIDELFWLPLQFPKLNKDETQTSGQTNKSMKEGNKQWREESGEREEIQGSETDKKDEAESSSPASGEFSDGINKTREWEPAEKFIKARGENQKGVKMQQSKASPSLHDETKSSSPGRKDKCSKPKKKSGDESQDIDLLNAPSTSKQATGAEALASTRYRKSRKPKAQKKSKPERKDESNSDIDTDIESDSDTGTKTDPKGKTRPNARSETGTGYSSDTSENCESVSDSDKLYTKGDSNKEDSDEDEQWELNKCIMSLLSSNSIIRDVGVINPQTALDVAKTWAQLSRFSGTITLLNPEDFNPFEVYPKPQRHSPLFGLLTESLPQEIFRKWEAYSDSLTNDKPEFEQSQMKKDHQEKADSTSGDLDILKSKSRFEKPKLATIVIKKLDLKEKRRYRVAFDNVVYRCTRNDLKVLRKMKLFEDLETYLKRGKFHIKWYVTEKKQDLILKEFQRTFSLYIASREHLLDIGEKIDFSGKVTVVN